MHDFPLLNTIAVGFAAAWLLGIITQRLGLSPIVGYLLAGVAIGPHTPGFVGDPHSAAQLAELGVILLMFGVGLHFHLKELLAVKRIAIPGALAQSAAATLLGALVMLLFGWTLAQGLVLGVAMSVASTVVLTRVLMDNHRLEAPEGHAAIGWLIVEDIITVLVLVLIPALAGVSAVGGGGGVGELHPLAESAGTSHVPLVHTLHTLAAHAFAQGAAPPPMHWAWAMLLAVGKLSLLVALVLVGGSRLIPRLLVFVARVRSRELFTLTILVLSVAVAVGSAALFGASVALGAFLAGMVVGQSPASRQAAADLLPLRDAFAVLFFVSVGMLFDPGFLVSNPLMVLAGLAVVLAVKPVVAVLVVVLLKYPPRTALTVAVGLAQIGEFSFIVADLGLRLNLIPAEARHILVACAIISITLNPLLFRSLPRVERWLQARPRLWNVINRAAPAAAHAGPHASDQTKPLAVIVGFGPSGQQADRLLRDAGIDTLVLDLNMNAVSALASQGRRAVFGDASQPAILEQAGVPQADYLVLTMPDAAARTEIIVSARELRPGIRVFARARYVKDQEVLRALGVQSAAVDEVESAVALSRLVLLDLGANRQQVKAQLQRVRQALQPGGPSGEGPAPVASPAAPSI